MFCHDKTSTFIQCSSLFRIECAKEATLYEFEDLLFDLCSCLREKTRLKRTLLHIIKQCRMSSIAKLPVMFYSNYLY